MEVMDSRKRQRRPHQRRRRDYSLLMICLLIMLIIFLTAGLIFLFYSYKKEKLKSLAVMRELEEIQSKEEIEAEEEIKEEENLYTKSQVEKEVYQARQEMLDTMQTMMENGDGTLSLLQYFFPDDVVVSESGGYRFFPILDSLEKNNFILDNFTYPEKNEETGKWEGIASYKMEDGSYARRGIDVSTFQGEIDWQKVKNSGMEYAIIRLGFRGYESGKIVLDSRYEENIEGSLAAGLDTGVYFFTEALTEKEAIEEADFVLENLQGHKINMPVVIDVEESANTEKTRTKDLTAEQRTKNVIAFCNRIKDAGYDVMIYGNLKSFMLMLDIEQLEAYHKWFAYYRYPFHFPYKIKMWQYASWEEVEGIKGGVDVNLMFY